MVHTDTKGFTYYEMTMNSESGCAVITTDQFWFFLGRVKILIALVGIFLGLITVMAGRLLLKYVVFGSVIICVDCVADALVYIIYDGVNLRDSVYWSVIVVFTIVGLLLAWALTFKPNLGRGMLSLWLGFEIGTAISTMLYFSHMIVSVFWIIIAFVMILTLLVAAIDFNFHMIWVTSMVGSYTILTSLCVMWGKWPLDLNLPKLVEMGAVTATEPNFYLLMGIWMSFSAIGVVFQCMILWYYKKTGKPVHPRLQEAVDKFEYGRSAAQRKRDKAHKRFQFFVEHEMDGDTTEDGHESLYLDMQTRGARSDSLQSDRIRGGGQGYRTSSRGDGQGHSIRHQ